MPDNKENNDLSLHIDDKTDQFFVDQEDSVLALEGGEYFASEHEKDVILFIGAGDVAQEVARLARYAGFIIDVLDNDYFLARHERFPTARQVLYCDSFAEIEKKCAITSNHYIIISTENLETDLEVLKHTLHSKARYIGVHGSDENKEALFAALRKDGIPAAELACIFCPTGLPIGAKNLPETGISIIAELIAARSGRLKALRLSKNSSKK